MLTLPDRDPLAQAIDRSGLLAAGRCLGCKVCCRFPFAGSPLAPFFSNTEIGNVTQPPTAVDRIVRRPSSVVAVDSAICNPQSAFCSPSDFPPGGFGPGHSPFLVAEPEFHRCPAFRPAGNDCRIYPRRPFDCRLYPLMLIYSEDGSQVLLGLDSYCPAVADNADSPQALQLLDEASRLLDGELLDRVVECRGIVGAWKDHLIHTRPLAGLSRALCRSDLGLARFVPTVRDRLAPFFAAHGSPLSYHAFAALHAWTDVFDLRWKISAGRLLLFAQGDGDTFLIVPPLGPSLERRSPDRPGTANAAPHDGAPSSPEADLIAAARDALQLLRALDPRCPSPRIQEVDDATARTLLSAGWRIRETAHEYLYDRVEIAELHGNRFEKKRQPCNRFEREHAWRWRTLDPDDLPAAAGLYRRWLDRREAGDGDDFFRAQAEVSFRTLWRSLRDAELTGLVARVLEADGRVVGFTAGCPLSDGKTFAVLYEISDLAVTGAAQVLFREFCRELTPFSRINAGSDSGLAGLARVKESWRPALRAPSHTLVPA